MKKLLAMLLTLVVVAVLGMGTVGCKDTKPVDKDKAADKDKDKDKDKKPTP